MQHQLHRPRPPADRTDIARPHGGRTPGSSLAEHGRSRCAAAHATAREGSMRLRGAIAMVCSMVLAACGGPGGDEKTVPSDSELLAQADTCSELTYDWPQGAMDAQKTCAGPWQQQCCNMGTAVVSSCRHPFRATRHARSGLWCASLRRGATGSAKTGRSTAALFPSARQIPLRRRPRPRC